MKTIAFLLITMAMTACAAWNDGIIRKAANQPTFICEDPNCQGENAASVAKTKLAIKRMLIDEEGARFRQVYVTSGYMHRRRTVCGLVNPRNQFGGMGPSLEFYNQGGDVRLVTPDRRVAAYTFSRNCEIRPALTERAEEIKRERGGY